MSQPQDEVINEFVAALSRTPFVSAHHRGQGEDGEECPVTDNSRSRQTYIVWGSTV